MENNGRLKINVGHTERTVSSSMGAALVGAALTRRLKLSSVPLLAAGGYLIFRGVTGHCLFYNLLGIERAGERGRKGIEVERAVTINLPRPQIYDFWRNFENLPRFMEHLESVHVIDPRRSHWVAKAPLGQTVEWDSEIYDEREYEYISWHSLPGSQVKNSGTVTFTDAPGNRGTEVHVWMQYEPVGGSAAAAVAKLMGEEPTVQVREDLRHFKQILETGEIPTTLGQSSGRQDEVDKERDEIMSRKRLDVVQEASEQSFPASDAPGWTSTTLSGATPRRREEKK